MISVPFLTPHLSSLWLGRLTPVYARVGRELIGGLQHRTVVTIQRRPSAFPIRPARPARGHRSRHSHEDRAFALTRWSDALPGRGPERAATPFRQASSSTPGRCTSPVDADRAFAPVARIGGESGWYYGDVAVADQGRDRPAAGRRRNAARTTGPERTGRQATPSTSGASRPANRDDD